MTGAKTKIEREHRRKRLQQLLAEGVTSPTLLAEELDVTRRTVHNDLEAVRDGILSDDRVDSEKFVAEVLLRNRAVNTHLWNIAHDDDVPENIRLGALNGIRKNTRDMARILGDLGIIEKQAERILVRQEDEEPDYDPIRQALERIRAKREQEKGEEEENRDTVSHTPGEER